MEEDYILAKRLASKIACEDEEIYPFFVLGIYGILRVFKENKDIVEDIIDKVDIYIDNKPINEIMRNNGYSPDEYFGSDTGDTIEEGEVCSYAVSSNGHNYILCNDEEFVDDKGKPFIICSTLRSNNTMVLSSFIHEFAHLVKGEVNSTYLTREDDCFGYVIRCGMSIFECGYYPEDDDYYEANSYEIIDEVVNCSQTSEAGCAILELDGIIPDEKINHFFKLLDKEELIVDRGYQEACSAFKPLWNNEVLRSLISDNIVLGNIDFIIDEFNKIAGEDSFNRLDELLFKIDELDYLNRSDSDEMKTTRALVQTIIDIFNKKTNNGNNKGYQKK